MANPARVLIIVALVVGGIFVLANAFEAPTVTAGTEPAPSPTRGGGQGGGQGGGGQDQGGGDQDQGGQDQAGGAPDISGLRIAVFNATDETGLAATVDGILTRARYGAQQAMEPADAAENSETTGLYFEEDPDGANEAAARYIARRILEVPDATIAPLGRAPAIETGRISSDVQVAIFVGADYGS